MKKNSQLHIMLETTLLEKLKQEAEDRMISVGEVCRLKLAGSDRLANIEMLVEKIAKAKSINTSYDFVLN